MNSSMSTSRSKPKDQNKTTTLNFRMMGSENIDHKNVTIKHCTVPYATIPTDPYSHRKKNLIKTLNKDEKEELKERVEKELDRYRE